MNYDKQGSTRCSHFLLIFSRNSSEALYNSKNGMPMNKREFSGHVGRS